MAAENAGTVPVCGDYVPNGRGQRSADNGFTASTKKQPPFGDCFPLVEISGIEPLTS